MSLSSTQDLVTSSIIFFGIGFSIVVVIHKLCKPQSTAKQHRSLSEAVAAARATVLNDSDEIPAEWTAQYRVEMKTNEIVDKKTSNILNAASVSISPSTLFLECHSDGTLSGKRSGQNELFVLETGCIRGQKAYWVEGSRQTQYLTLGQFSEHEFTGEWLSSQGQRGTYTVFEKIHTNV